MAARLFVSSQKEKEKESFLDTEIFIREYKNLSDDEAKDTKKKDRKVIMDVLEHRNCDKSDEIYFKISFKWENSCVLGR